MKSMKKAIIWLAALALVAAGCAKPEKTGTNDANKRYFDSWVKINHPGADKTDLGSYVIDSKDGTGELIGDKGYVRALCTISGLDGKVASTTDVKMAQQIGTYDESYYYGPATWCRLGENLYAGVDELLEGKHVGAHIKAAIPGWLLSLKRYKNAQGYLDNVTGTDRIYDFTIVDAFDDVTAWELDSLVNYVKANYPGVDTADTLDSKTNKWGLYYVCTQPTDLPDSTFASGSKVYFNYTGRLLNGKVFDTTIENLAKDEGIYSSSRTYGPTFMNWAESWSDMTMGSGASSVIDGFKFAISNMKPHEKGLVIFHSNYGYKYNGSGSAIPAYSPLIFEFELVDED